MSRGPNTRLEDLFRLAGWSKGELARLVNRQAAAQGYPQLATDTSRVRRWIDVGETPRDPVPEVLATLFTERLGRVVTIEDLGLRRSGDAGTRPSVHGLPWAPRRTAAVLTEFTGMDLMLNRRGMVGAGVALAAGSALSDAMHDWLRAAPARDAASPHDPSSATDPAGFDRYEAAPVGAEEIEALEHSVEIFRAWDASRGGGLQRKAVVGQLNEVGGMLAYRHPDALQRRLWGVAADLAVLAGWMSHDIGLEPTAQKYFVIAAHAAREGGDRPRAGEALSRAARQMVHLGRPDDALDLLRLAGSGMGEEALPRTRAMLCTIEAWARAALGQGQATRRLLGEAEHLFVTERNDTPPPGWMRMFDEADLYGMQALAYRTLAEHEPTAARPALRNAEQALALRVDERQRSRIFDEITLASACLIADEPERADHHARLALSAVGENSSHRTWDRLRQMRRLTGPYAGVPRIDALREELDEALPAAAGAPRPV
ncbi:DNA-binding protein NsdB [Streptomyces sp. URMC 129]|uniref:DNA-binding protein NsdB n=1 Tax=Streptomyces sp. URMC 129 TaxID=3423407 RepID=UPI003F19B53B